MCGCPGNTNNTTIINYCILYVQHFIYLHKRNNIDILSQLSFPKMTYPLRKISAQPLIRRKPLTYSNLILEHL